MSEYSTDRKKRYIKKMLKPGERIWFVRLTGHMMTKARTKVFVALARKAWELADKKDPWQLFRFGIERDIDNKHDDSAVSIFLWHNVDGEWTKRQLGFIPRSERGKGKVYHSKAFALWLDEGKVLNVEYTMAKGSEETFESPLVRLVHIHWDEKKNFGSAHFAIHTPYSVTQLPRGVKELESVGQASEGDEPEALHEGKLPVVETFSFPDEKVIDRLITAHQEFQKHFSYTDSEGECNAVFMLQCSEPRPYKDEAAFQEDWDGGHDATWIFPETTESIKKVQNDYGPVMARNYYRFTGLFEGPFDQHHTSRVLATINELLVVARKLKK
jgi:hypothetical protein